MEPIALSSVLLAAPPAGALLRWYDRNRRTLPWRAAPGEAADPYLVWLSEIMLQQTTVATVIPYYESFVSRFPTVADLAAAPEQAVLSAWAGLGYYARARNLHACAREVAARGGFPETEAELRFLPGIGAYTAAAIAAIAFQRPAVPVDGNVTRVVCRLFAIREVPAKVRAAIAEAATRLGADADAMARPSDFAQALFELGAGICTPTQPACLTCPWQGACAAQAAGIAAELPTRPLRAARPQRYGAQFWLEDDTGRVLLRHRPAKGLLGGMTELPGTPWRADPWGAREALTHAPAPAEWAPRGTVRHVFTHFELTLQVFAARTQAINPQQGFLLPVGELGDAALPSVMRKCVALARGGPV